MPSHDEMIQQALSLHRGGRLDEAAAIYRQSQSTTPNHGDALQLLGAIAHKHGAHDQAIELLRRSLVVQPGLPLVLARSTVAGLKLESTSAG